MPKDSQGLTPKQRRFVEEYLIDRNGTQAAIRAGYSKDTARQIADQNLSKLYIADEVRKREAELQKKTEIDQVWVRKRLQLISDFNAEAIAVPFGSGENAIVHKRMRDANAATRATELLGKDVGMFTDKVELSGKNGEPIEFKDRSEREEALIRKLGSFLSKKLVEKQSKTSK